MEDLRPLYLALTLDVDPDANRAVRGRPDAVGPDGEVSYDACRHGLELVREVNARHGVPVTLFWEGRGLRRIAEADPGLVAAFAADPLAEHGGHGFRHEDYAGAVSGRAMSRDEIDASLQAAEGAFADVLEQRPAGFRAPYCRMTGDLAEALANRGYVWDASVAIRTPVDSRLGPFRLPESASLWELPLGRARDAHGRPISSYLWQLCEGRRQVDDYVTLVDALRGPCGGGLLQVALHPWHLVVGEDGRHPPPARGGAPAARLDALLERLVGLEGVEFVGLSAYLEAWLKGAEGAE